MKDYLLYFLPAITQIIRYFLFAGGAFLIFYKFFPAYFSTNKIQDKWAQKKDFVREILHSIQTSIIIGVVVVLCIFTPLGEYSSIYRDISEFPTWWIPVSVILALVLHDSYFYWMHRTLHHPKLYKHAHLTHHKSINPSPWASYSFHAIEGFTEALIVPLIIFLIPIHPLALMLFGMTSLFINVYGHLGFEIMPKWFRNSIFFEFVNTSVHHNIHHEKFVGNYGLYFRVWDRIMGTEHPDYVKEFDVIQEKRFEINKAGDLVAENIR